MSLTFNQSESHASVTPDAVTKWIDAGTTEKRSVALVLRDAGYSNQEGGDAFGDLFGTKIKSGGFGNLVTGALRDVGRGGEIESTPGSGGGTKTAKVRELDPIQMMRDELDRERAALDAVETPVADADAFVLRHDSDPDGVVADEKARLEKVIAETKALITALTKTPDAFVAASREKATVKRDAVKSAAGDRAKVHRANVERLVSVLTVIDAATATAGGDEKTGDA